MKIIKKLFIVFIYAMSFFTIQAYATGTGSTYQITDGSGNIQSSTQLYFTEKSEPILTEDEIFEIVKVETVLGMIATFFLVFIKKVLGGF